MAGGFSSKRLALVLRRDAEYHWQAWLKYAAMAGMAWFTFLVAAYGHNSHGFVNMTSDSAMRWKGYFLRVFLATAMVIGASLGGLNTWRTDRRTALLMLPASVAEKFVARILEVTVVLFVYVLVAVAVADLLHLCFSLAAGTTHGVRSLTVALAGSVARWWQGFFLHAGSSSAVGAIAALHTIAVLAWCQSLYLLGSVLFVRGGWLVVSAVLLLGWIFVAVPLRPLLYDSNRIAIGSAMIVVYIALVVVNYALAYRLSGRQQVARSKWINI